MNAQSYRLLAAVVGGLLLSFVGGCATTTVETVWKTPDPTPVPFTKVLAMVANATPAERRAGEDEFAAEIKSAHAVAAYTLIPDEDMKDRAKVLAVLNAQGFDGAAVIRLVSTDKETEYVPPTYSATRYPFGSSGYYDYGSYDSYNRGYTVTTTVITAEISVYSVKDQKLIWAGSSRTEDPSGIRDLISQVCRGSAAELRKQGFLK